VSYFFYFLSGFFFIIAIVPANFKNYDQNNDDADRQLMQTAAFFAIAAGVA